jgi:hypothetical protein
MSLHHPLHRDRSRDVHSRGCVVALAVPGSLWDQRILIRHTWALGGFRQAIDITHETHHRPAAPPAGHVAGGHPGAPHLHLESLIPEDGRQVVHGPEFLESQLTVREHLIHDLLGELLQRSHLLQDLLLELLRRESALSDRRCGEGQEEEEWEGERDEE